jgi:serine protease AprX
VTEQIDTCPVCERPAAAALLAKAAALDPLVERRIAASRPGWAPQDGVCPACVQVALQALLRHDAPFSLRAEQAGVHPDDLPDLLEELFVLSTPMRLQSWPHVTGRGVTAAFVDAGFYDHPDLTTPHDRIVLRVDARRNPPRAVERNDVLDPSCFHGLMTTSVAAGNGAGSNGHYRGLAPDARLVLVRVGDPKTGRIAEAHIARGLTWLVDHAAELNVRVVNVSLGGDRPAPSDANPVDPLVEQLVEAGVTVVVAAGNEGRREIVPPGSAPSAITVGGIDDANTVDRSEASGWQSNFGPTPDGVHKPEVVAPSIWVAAPVLLGSEVHERAAAIFHLLSTPDDDLPVRAAELAGPLGLAPESLAGGAPAVRHAVAALRREMKLLTSRYQHVEGTSFAAPIVTGLVMQMLEVNAALTPAEIKGILMATATVLPQVPREAQGAGVVNPALALDLAARYAQGPLPDFVPWPRVADGEVAFQLTATADRVDVIGDFNGWGPGTTPLEQVSPGVWRASAPRPGPGTYRYKFLVDRETWIDDPENPHREWDGYGGLNSVLRV